MRVLTGFLLVLSLAMGCSNNDTPDISGVTVNLNVRRFEQDFFKSDTTRMTAELAKLNATYPDFMPFFMVKLLGADPQWNDDSAAAYTRHFISSYTTVNDSVQRIFSNFTTYEKNTRTALQYLKHYFPGYKAPEKLITYVGPLDGFGDILSANTFFIGLQHHLGKEALFYQNDLVQQTYPAYIAAHFEPDMIPVNCMELVIDDMNKDPNEDMSLVQQMVQQGKKMFILSKLLPKTEEYRLIRYTAAQLKDCYAHEAQIWSLFVQNGLLQTTDKNIIKDYIGKSPKTQELGEGAPGNIGAFAGWQIVKKFMANHGNTTLRDLLQKDPDAIFQEARYKP